VAPETWGHLALALGAGIGLAAAAGLRAFLPLLALSLGARAGLLSLHDRMDFLQSDLALAALVVAALAEILADKVPLLDHALDALGTFVRPAVGFVAGLALFADFSGPLSIVMALFLALIALGTHVEHAKVRAGSTVLTAGMGNPVISTIEDAVAGTLSILAVLLPILAGILGLAILYAFWRLWRRIRRGRGPAPIRPLS
jgi:glucan phosphoethanolaminetransferase (alkaline phosphatase superfamily)